MKTFKAESGSSILIALMAAGLSGGVFGQSDTPVVVNTDGMSPRMAATITEKGQQGTAALRQYIERTKPIYQLDFSTVARRYAEPSAVATERPEQEKVAQSKP
jgi:hypothetical protein